MTLIITVARRRPNRQTSAEKAARRKSAPPNSLAIKPVNNPPPVVKPRETAGKDSSKGTPSKDSSKGTPSREGSTRRAPNREASDSAAVSKDVAEPAPREAAYRERRHRRPLDGGTLMREGKIFKAPTRDKKNLPLKQAQVKLLMYEFIIYMCRPTKMSKASTRRGRDHDALYLICVLK